MLAGCPADRATGITRGTAVSVAAAVLWVSIISTMDGGHLESAAVRASRISALPLETIASAPESAQWTAAASDAAPCPRINPASAQPNFTTLGWSPAKWVFRRAGEVTAPPRARQILPPFAARRPARSIFIHRLD